MKNVNVAIVGASGYTGLELVKILNSHPHFNITYIANSEGGVNLDELHPSMEKVAEYKVEKADAKELSEVAELAFLALPHKTSMAFAKELLELGVKVVDLSADYRLDLERYEEHYCPHEDKGNIKNAVYGLPEYYREEIAKSNLVANPGCYPTSTLLGLLPFIPYIDENAPIFVDAKSGVSGAGKKLSETTHFVTINENIFAYNPLKHRHAPEIAEKIEKVHGKKCSVNFVPHLINVTRGMLSSVYVTLKEDIDPIEVLNKAYKDEPSIRVKNSPVDIKSNTGTNFCDIYAQANGKALYIGSTIDNLLRGASSQAVVNANIMYGFDELCAIPMVAYVP